MNIKEVIQNIEKAKVHPEKGLFYISENKLINYPNTYITDDVYDFDFLDDKIIYTSSEIGNLKIVSNDKYQILEGYYYLNSLKETPLGYKIVKFDTKESLENKFCTIDFRDLSIKPTISYSLSTTKYHVKTQRGEIQVFNLNHELVWQKRLVDIDSTLDNSMTFSSEKIIVNDEQVLLQLSNYTLISINLIDGELIWLHKQGGRIYRYNHFLYTISNSKLSQIELGSGILKKQLDIGFLSESKKNFPIGPHKVYDEKIFVLEPGRVSKLAHFQRDTLEFDGLIEINDIITNDCNHFFSFNNTLIIHGFSKKLYLYE
jgi:hypothetical protein